MDTFIPTLLVGLLLLVVSLLLMYYIIKAATLEALKQHTRWTISNRAELEQKYSKTT